MPQITPSDTDRASPTLPVVFVPTSSTNDDIPPPKADFNAPPPYEVAIKTTKLPTYEEAERLAVTINAVPPTRVS